MSIIQTTATIGLGARRRPPITPREVRPARWQLSGLLICGVLFSALGAIPLALGMDANRSAAPVACGLLMMVAAAVGLRQGRRTALTLDGRACQIATADGQVWIPWQEQGSSTRGREATSCSRSTPTSARARRSGRPGARCAGCWAPRRWSTPSPWRSLHSAGSLIWLLRGVTALLCCGWVASGVALLAH